MDNYGFFHAYNRSCTVSIHRFNLFLIWVGDFCIVYSQWNWKSSELWVEMMFQRGKRHKVFGTRNNSFCNPSYRWCRKVEVVVSWRQERWCCFCDPHYRHITIHLWKLIRLWKIHIFLCRTFIFNWSILALLPWKLTCPLKINGWKMYSLLK